MRFNRRYERKYLIDLFTYYQIKMYLKAYTNPDKFNLNNKKGRYLVRSLYFDNDSLDAFYEKENGNWGRIKFRIRSYQNEVKDSDLLSFELKTKKGNIMEKYSQFIKVVDYNLFMKGQYKAESKDKLMIEIERLRQLKNLKPLLIVEYEREGFISKIKSEEVRITFDHNIKYTRAEELFPNFLNFKNRREKNIVLELKNKGPLPSWLSKMIKRYQLKEVANSKFYYGMIVINQDIVTINKNKKMTLLTNLEPRLISEGESENKKEKELVGVGEVGC